MADIEAFNDRVQRLEQASVKLSGAILAYMKQAISEDANARTAVESSLRLLESVLGYRQQPVRDGAGTWRKPRCSALIPNPEWWC